MFLQSIGYTSYSQGVFNRNVRDLIVNVITTTLLFISIAMSAHYGKNLTTGKLIPITPNFSLSIELIIASNVGFMTLIILTVQIVRNRFTAPLFGIVVARHVSIKKMIRLAIHPFSNTNIKKEASPQLLPNDCMLKVMSVPNCVPQIITYPTRDRKMLPGCWLLQGLDRPTVICFHPNAVGMADFSLPWGKYYASLGFNVLLAEFRGYGDSNDVQAGSEYQELEAYLDAEAALKMVLSKGCDRSKIIAHGSSLGGAYAAALGNFFEIGTIVLDHTFTSPAAIVSTKSKIIPKAAIHEAIKQAYDQGFLPLDPAIGKKNIRTDGFNSLQKMKQADKSDLFVIQGKDDTLTPQRFGKQFIREKYQDVELQNRRLAIVDGDHNFYSFFEDPSAALAQSKFREFLQEKGLLTTHSLSTFFYGKAELNKDTQEFFNN